MIRWLVSRLVDTAVHVYRPGDRIQTKHGMGTVVGGSLTVRLDTAVAPRHERDTQWIFNIGKEI